MAFQGIVLAAGRGTRMSSSTPKALLPLCGKSIIAHVLDTLAHVGIARPVVVVGEDEQRFRDTLGGRCVYVRQPRPLGSGHAVRCALPAVGHAEVVVVMCGDSPLFVPETIRQMMEAHARERAAITLASAVPDDPSGYGRILRGTDGAIAGIVEDKLADESQRAIREINGGCYSFDLAWLWRSIHLIRQNDVGEYCLTDMVKIAVGQGRKVDAVSARSDEVLGVNTLEQLRAAERILDARTR